LNVELIFDDVDFHKDGSYTGGIGKTNMYMANSDLILEDLEFTESPPFTDAIRGIFRLFKSLAWFIHFDREPLPADVENVNKLKNCKEFIELLRKAKERKDWPKVSDKVAVDNYPPIQEADGEDYVGSSLKRVRRGSGNPTKTKRFRVDAF
jgi:hypothetical protein